ncbi:MAG: hypothetical protein FWC36_01045 [Spirochaetes bacterium]|nr:hypothetical protein [Spirochaetota bacterium]
MYYLSCDMCKKVLSNPKNGKNYNTIKHLHFCRKCWLAFSRDQQDVAEAENKPYDFLSKKEEFWGAAARRCKVSS